MPQAGAFGLREQSTTGQGMSFAGAAAGSGGVSSMYWNPATMTFQFGFRTESHRRGHPRSEISPDLHPSGRPLQLSVTSGDLGLDAVVPSGYTSYQINDRLWVGLATGAPFGLVTKPNDIWAGQLYARTTSVFSVEAHADHRLQGQ